MANEIGYYDTPYTFISPVRHFKANDPYYYEVDNIPIKQLEESQRFLKDQIDGIISRQNKGFEIDRSGFSELKPYATGNDRKVRVKPGKYSARINNAYSLTPLQVVEQIGGYSNTRNSDGTYSGGNTWRVQTNIGSVSSVLQEFQEGLLGDALNMNGLAERAFVFPIDDEDGLSYPQGVELLNRTTPGYSDLDSEFDPDERPLYPNYVGALLKHTTADTTRDLTLIRNVYTPGEIPSGSNQGRIESEFIKRWRGAIRTSIVDVAEELEITIPDFDLADFYYVDADGNQQPLNANHRMDLLFIYSKAVDEESTTIPKFDANGNPTTITKPTLGILKGAGIGISRQTAANNNNAEDRVSLQTLDGVPIMLAHPGDENGSNNGFTTSAGVIRGSFPSPDDLMNLAPVLSEQLETNAFPLIGQSILPIAYIRVQSPGGPIADIINEEDIIDIRPFFRTTELAYNERAGIAAATPQVSIANPVVTEAHLEKIRKEMNSEIGNRLLTLEGSIGNVSNQVSTIQGPGNSGARAIAAGQVLGGYWGPEGALIKHAKSATAGGIRTATMNQFVDLVESEFGYIPGSIPYLPDWDKATWYDRGSFTGDKICDHINMGAGLLTEFGGAGGDAKYMPPWVSERTDGQNSTVQQIRDDLGFERFSMYQWGPRGAGPYGSAAGRPNVGGTNSLFGTQTLNLTPAQLTSLNARNVQINYVRKTIKLDLQQTPWVRDYHVNVNLLHCTPLCDATNPAALTTNNGQGITNNRNSCQVWVQKYKDYFTICVAWAGTNHLGKNSGAYFPWAYRDDPERFAGFTQPQMQLVGSSPWTTYGTSPFGYSVNYGDSAQRQEFFNQQTAPPANTTGLAETESDYFNPLVPLLYPSVRWEVVGIADDFITNSFGAGGNKMRERNPTVSCT
jgi:hypothetical protein